MSRTRSTWTRGRTGMRSQTRSGRRFENNLHLASLGFFSGTITFVFPLIAMMVVSQANDFCTGCSFPWASPLVYQGVSQKHFFRKKLGRYPHVPLWGLYKAYPKAFFCRIILEGHTTYSKIKDFYNVDFHSAYSRPGQVSAERESTL